MPVLVEDTTDHAGHQLPLGEGPIGHGETGVIAGNQRSRDHQQKGRTGGRQCEVVKTLVILAVQ